MNRFWRIISCVLGLLAPLPVWAESAFSDQRVLNIAIEDSNLYSINMWVPFGSNADSIPGIAHVLEHLKFKGNDGKGFSDLEAVAGSASNASTTQRYTRYDLNVPREGLDEALRNLATIITPLKITDADLATEKAIVTQELYQRTQSDPDTQFYMDYNAALMKGTSMERYPGGTPADVARVTMQDVIAFDIAHYPNAPFYMQIAGPFLSDKNRAAIAKHFPHAVFGQMLINKELRVKHEDEKLMALPAFFAAGPAPSIAPDTLEQHKSSELARTIKFTWSKVIAAPTPWKAVVAASIINDAMRSRLSEGLRDKVADDANLVQDWSIYFGRVDDGIWQLQFSGSLQRGVTPEQMQGVVETYLANLAQGGLSQKSFDRLKKRNFLYREWENVDRRVQTLGQDAVNFGLKDAVSSRQVMEDLRLEDVNQLLKSMQSAGRIGVALITPADVAAAP